MMGRPDRIYFVETSRPPYGGPHFDPDEARAAAATVASASGKAVRVVGVPVDFCETVQPPQRERCEATKRIDGVGAGQCTLEQLHVQEHRADIGGRTWRWPVER